MKALDQLLPEGYVLVHGRRGSLGVRAEFAEQVARAGFGPDTDGALVPSDLRGRRGLRELPLEDERLVVRSFSHGGLARWLTGTRFRDPLRPFRELAQSEELRAAGVRTPLVIAARARRAALFGWRLAVVTRRVPGALDLGHLLGAARRGDVPRRHVRSVLRALGALIAQLHASGFVHADLNPNNVLVELDTLDAEHPRLWVLDLDRSEFAHPIGDRRRRDNLRRLFRHIDRREARHGAVLTRTDLLRFLASYDRAWNGAGDWKDDWRAIAAAHARVGLAHRLGWLLERALAGARDERHE